MTIEIERKCQDYRDRPGCLGEVDERYTMDYTDIVGGDYIYWCAHCGPEAHRLAKAFEKALKERGPEFAAETKALLDEAEAKERAKRN